jgi:excisionase family DNA binding protein
VTTDTATTRALFSTTEAAELLGITPRALYHWVGAGIVPADAVFRVGHRVRIKGWWLRQLLDGPDAA